MDHKDLRNLELFESTTQYDYKWKLGISLLDLGFAQYKHGLYSGNANGLKYSISVPALLKKFDSTIIDLSTFNDSARTIANQFTNYYTTFNIQHPTRMVFNVDHPITDVISINAELSLPVSLPSAKTDFTLKTLAYATITPRMEEERYGLFLPLSINANGYFWMGGSIQSRPIPVRHAQYSSILSENSLSQWWWLFGLCDLTFRKIEKDKVKRCKVP